MSSQITMEEKPRRTTLSGLARAGTRMVAAVLRPLVYVTLPLVAKVMNKLVRGNDAYEVFARNGFYLLRKHFYSPIPEADDCTDEYWDSTSDLVGIEINEDGIAHYVENELAPFRKEFERYPLTKEEAGDGFYLLNGAYMAVDGDMYYSLIRHVRPGRIIEVGCGFSTFLASDAVLKNSEEGIATTLLCVEPYPPPHLRRGIPGVDRFLETKVQQVEHSEFSALRENDILFIDTTHVLKSGGDVQYLYCEILPRLAPGVLVHVHDISLPRHYPKVYYEKNKYFWNEQYLLQAFLSHNARAEVVWPGNYMMVRRPDWMLTTFPGITVMRDKYPSSEPSSFWFKTK